MSAKKKSPGPKKRNPTRERPIPNAIKKGQKRRVITGGPGEKVPGEKTIRVYSKAETRQHIDFVAGRMSMHYGTRTIKEHFEKEYGYRPSDKRIKTLISYVEQEWKIEDSVSLDAKRAKQLRSLETVFRTALTKGQLATAVRAQEQIARMTGTNEPVRIHIDANVQHALLACIGELDPKEMTTMLARAEERKRLADAYEEESKARVIDADEEDEAPVPH